jgi:hypothetical protein
MTVPFAHGHQHHPVATARNFKPIQQQPSQRGEKALGRLRRLL